MRVIKIFLNLSIKTEWLNIFNLLSEPFIPTNIYNAQHKLHALANESIASHAQRFFKTGPRQ